MGKACVPGCSNNNCTKQLANLNSSWSHPACCAKNKQYLLTCFLFLVHVWLLLAVRNWILLWLIMSSICNKKFKQQKLLFLLKQGPLESEYFHMYIVWMQTQFIRTVVAYQFSALISGLSSFLPKISKSLSYPLHAIRTLKKSLYITKHQNSSKDYFCITFCKLSSPKSSWVWSLSCSPSFSHPQSFVFSAPNFPPPLWFFISRL